MFSTSHTLESNKFVCSYNSEHVVIWKGVFINALRRVLEQVHPSLTARHDALEYVECFIIQLLRMLCSRPSPHTISDVEHRVRTTFPTPIDRWALEDAKEALEKFKKRSPLVLPIDKIHHLLQKEVLQYKIDLPVVIFIAAVLEYISADLLKLTGNYVKNIHHMEITCQDIRVAMCADKVLSDMFSHNNMEHVSETDKIPEKSTYVTTVKDFIHDEKLHLRNLNMILKVFLDEIENVINIKQIWELQNMIQNLNDIADFTFAVVSSFEDMLEMADDKHSLLVGSFLEELAEDEEFEIYARYTKDICQMNAPNLLIDLLSSHNALNILPSAGQGFKEAVKYYLPKLFRYPIWHCFTYFEYTKMLQDLSAVQSDKDNFEQLEGLLKPLHLEMQKLVQSFPKNEKEHGLRLHGRLRHNIVADKIDELLRTVDGFEQRYSKQCCTEFMREDTLHVYTNSKRMAERRSILFDGMLVICKRKWTLSVPGQSSMSGSASPEYKLKDVFYIRKVEIKDRDDTDEIKNSFEVIPREQLPVIFIAKNYDDKCNWMSDLIMLNTKCMLDRSLNSVLENEEKKNPVHLPPVSLYRFSEPDTPSNIVFEERKSSYGMAIKGATLLKLVEKLTYHLYTDASFIRTFLITYHTFTTSQEFLSLLIERFNIPNAYDTLNIPNTNLHSLTSKEKEDMKRYKKQYYQPIRFRVMNVLKRWVDSYYDDIENSQDVLQRMYDFLNSIQERSMRKWADCILNILQRKKDPEEVSREAVYIYDHLPPPIEWHILCPENEWTILTLHPVELARQLTLIEYEMYRVVKSSELVGSVWTKENKEICSPNIIKIMKHTTNFTLWLEKTIVETPNLEERIAIMSRMIEIMLVLVDLNNYNGVFAILSALGSACVYRLKHSFQGCSSRLQKCLFETRELFGDHFKKYKEKLRTITAPCVPFFGIFLTKILHIEEANKDFLPVNEETRIKLINFGKRRRVAEITFEIQQFQDQPYYLITEPRIKRFLETLEPFVNMSEADIFTYLYQKSLDVEPRSVKQPPRCPRRWPDVSLKSPGIKTRNSHCLSKLYIACNPPKVTQIEDDCNTSAINNNLPVYESVTSDSNNNSNSALLLHHDSSAFLQQARSDHKFHVASMAGNSTSVNPSNFKDFSIFTPIFFGPDLSSELEHTHQGSLFISDHSHMTGGPPLPPRMKRTSRPQSPILESVNPVRPPRDLCPPPLPPRRDSLQTQNSYVDSSNLDAAFNEKNSLSPTALCFPSSDSVNATDSTLMHSPSMIRKYDIHSAYRTNYNYAEENYDDEINLISTSPEQHSDLSIQNIMFFQHPEKQSAKPVVDTATSQELCFGPKPSAATAATALMDEKQQSNNSNAGRRPPLISSSSSGVSGNRYPSVSSSTAVSSETAAAAIAANDEDGGGGPPTNSQLESFIARKVVPSMFQFNVSSAN